MALGNLPEQGIRAVVKDIGKFMADIGRMNNAVKSAGQRMQQVGAGMTSAGRSLTMGLTLPILAVGGGALKMASDFETAFTEVTTLFDLPKEQIASLRKDVLGLAKTMGVDPVEAAKAMYQAISAGVPAANVISFLNENVQLAVGGVTDLETSVDLTTTVMNAWGKTTADLTDINDSLFLAVRQGKTTIGELGQSYFQVAPVAAAFGFTIDEVNASVATLTASGTPTSESMTQIRQAMLSLGAPTIRQKKRLDEMGISFSEAELRQKGFINVAKELFDAADGNKEVLRKLLGSVEAVNAVLVIGGKGYERATRNLAEYEDKAGSAKLAFDKMNETFGRQVTILKTELKVALIKLGAALIPVARSMIKGFRVIMKVLDGLIGAFTKLPKGLKIAIIAFFALLAAIGPVLLILGTLLTAVGAFVALMPFMATAIASVGGAFLVAAPFMLAFLGVTLLLIAAAPLVIENWEPISHFFSKTLPNAFKDTVAGIKATVEAIPRFLSGLAAKAIRIGASIINAVSSGISSAASGLFRVISQLVVGIIKILSPANYIWGSTVEDVFGASGKAGAQAFFKAIKTEGRKGRKRAGKDLLPIFPDIPLGLDEPVGTAGISRPPPDVPLGLGEPVGTTGIIELELGDTTAFDEMEAAAESAGDEAGEEAGNAFLSSLEDIVHRSMGAVSSALAAPLEAMRGVVESLGSELQRLAGLPSVESAMEDLERAQLAVQEAALRPQLRQAREARERIRDIDDEIDALVEQREELIHLAQGHTAESDAIDDQIRALAEEKAGLEESADAIEAEQDAIQKQIDALNDLAATREAERAVAVARAQIADQTLATDQEIIAALGRMEPLISEITGAINEQVNDLQTRFIPAWNEAAAATAGGLGGGAGIEGAGEIPAPDFTEINKAIEDAMKDIDDPLRELLDLIKKWAPAFAAVGATLLAFALFGWNVGLVVGVVAAVALLFVTFRKEILAGGKAVLLAMGKVIISLSKVVKKLPKLLKKYWKKVVAGALLALFPPAGGLFLIITNFNKIKDFVLGIVDDMADEIEKTFSELASAVARDVSGLVSAVLGFFSSLYSGVTGFVSDLVDEVTSFFGDMATEVADTVSGLVESLVGWFQALPGRVVGALSGLPGLIGGIASSAVTTFLGFFEGLPGAIASFFGGIPGAIIAALGDFAGLLVDLIIEPIKDAINLIPDIPLPFGLGTVGDVVGGIGSIVPDIPDIPDLNPFQAGAFRVPGTGSGDRVPALLEPGEMVVPRTLADLIRSQVNSFEGLSDLVSGRSGGATALGNFMSSVGSREGRDVLPTRMPVDSSVSVSAPISVTIQSQSWEEIRRVVHQEVDSALEDARQETVRAGAELSGSIL